MSYVLFIGACQTFGQNPQHLAIMLAKSPVQKNVLHSATIGSGKIRIGDKDYHFA